MRVVLRHQQRDVVFFRFSVLSNRNRQSRLDIATASCARFTRPAGAGELFAQVLAGTVQPEKRVTGRVKWYAVTRRLSIILSAQVATMAAPNGAPASSSKRMAYAVAGCQIKLFGAVIAAGFHRSSLADWQPRTTGSDHAGELAQQRLCSVPT